MDFGIPTLIENGTLRENVDLCQSLGFKFVELNMNLPGYQPNSLTNLLRRRMRDEPVYFTIHLNENLNVADFNDAVANAYFDTVKSAIDIALDIGAPVLNMHMNHGVYFTLPHGKVYLFEKYKDRYATAYRKLREICESAIGDADVSVCIENTDAWKDFEIDTIEYLLKSKVFGLTFDIGHSHAVGDADERFLIGHRDKLRHFHIHDALGNKNHLALGSGEIDLQARLALAEGCDCRCVVKTKTVEALKQSAVWLKSNEATC